MIDTKWKLVSTEPSMEDLRQMYAYHHYFKAKKVALMYPGNNPEITGSFVPIDKKEANNEVMECGLLFSQVETKKSVKDWQKTIGEMVNKWTG